MTHKLSVLFRDIKYEHVRKYGNIGYVLIEHSVIKFEPLNLRNWTKFFGVVDCLTIRTVLYSLYWIHFPLVYYDNFAFFQGGQDILIRVKFLIFLKKTGNFGSGNLNHKLSPRTCLFHNRDSHLFNDKNLWKTRELRLFFNTQPF